MTAFEIVAGAWIPISAAIVIGFVSSIDRTEPRLIWRKARHAAE